MGARRAPREGWAAGPSSVPRQVAPAGQAVKVMVWLGLESWSTRPTGQAVRVMVWLGLESWSDTYTLFPWSHHTLSIVRLGVRQTRPTGQAVRVIVWLGLESWSDTTHWAGGQSHGLAWVRVMVRHVYIVPSESS